MASRLMTPEPEESEGLEASPFASAFNASRDRAEVWGRSLLCPGLPLLCLFEDTADTPDHGQALPALLGKAMD
ncbi:BCHE [Symbiodinium sp. CCMP2592]|nr:BCHE [Symbiodinium sp. CCMP2592]